MADATPKKVSGNVLAEVEAERKRQPEVGYGPDHDDEFGVGHLAIEIERRARFNPAYTTDEQARVALVKIAAMSIAAIEVIDRRAGDGVSTQRVDLNDNAARLARRQ